MEADQKPLQSPQITAAAFRFQAIYNRPMRPTDASNFEHAGQRKILVWARTD
jgi:hypothetical protein